MTFANANTTGATPSGIFVNTNNTVYAASRLQDRIDVWLGNSSRPNKTISGNLSKPSAVFVTDDDDVYVDNGSLYGRVDRWTSNATRSVPAMKVNDTCTGLFVDQNTTLYCSMEFKHQVIKKPIYASANYTEVAAGRGIPGSGVDTLNRPNGIFVDNNLTLYVADCANNRVQRFRSDPYSGTTVAINGASGNITLSCPRGVTLDRNGYLFIVDSSNNRIIGSGPAGFRCLVGCLGSAGPMANQLNSPRTLSFDSYGNMFVTDWTNSRIQKFFLDSNQCSEYSCPLRERTHIRENSTLSEYLVSTGSFPESETEKMSG